MEHFFCEGTCKGVSETAGVCKDEACPNFGEPLVPCDCEDGVHHKTENDSEEEDED